ncbi:aldo/keto reductase [Bacillus sp. CGMCC 1.16607]|uniref:aldo/keto reductase n=1 Tax=Bacillus sp. CGMCC 1.16607 TaxID=3351842 RepID=UPI0036420B8F
MQKRKLGQSDLFVSEIGLGCMSLGTNEANAHRVINAAFEEGINYFDTADLYDFGVNEQIVGSALKKVRDQVVIATKVGNRWNDDKCGWSWDPSKAYIKEQVKQSLKRLGTDYIDLYQLHGGTMEDRIEESIEAFEELKSEGFIRYYGISSIRPNVIREYVEKSSIVSVMMQYSLLDRRPEESAIPLLAQHEISIVCRGTLAKGILTEKKWDDFSTSIKEKGYLDYSSSELMNLLYSLEEKLSGRTLTEVATQYCLSDPTVATVVAGASSPEQVRKNVQSAQSQVLSKEELGLLRQITKRSVYKDHR